MKQFNLADVRDNKPFEVLHNEAWYKGKLLKVFTMPLQGKRVRVSYETTCGTFINYFDLPCANLRMKEDA